MIPRKLNSLDKLKLIEHLHSLQGDDRRLRFGGIVTDEYITNYVSKTFDNKHNKWFGVEINNVIVAACHASIIDDIAELGCSVNEEYRGNGFAQTMFDRAVTWLRTKGITDVCMHCLTENSIMKHIARKNDMVVVTDSGETDANVHLDPPTPIVHMVDAYADRMALYDMMVKRNISIFRSIVPNASN